jgi:hypothetical protein
MNREGSSKGWPTMEVLELMSITSAQAHGGGGARAEFKWYVYFLTIQSNQPRSVI